MKRTRKWAFVAQEATRLAALGLSPVEIARRLEVHRSTVQQWMAAGKLPDTRRDARRQTGETPRSAGAWAAAVRASYALDATDDELVTLGETALAMVHDPKQAPQVQLNALGRFLAVVKQLALVARAADAVPAAKPVPVVTKRVGADPRTFLQAVK